MKKCNFLMFWQWLLAFLVLNAVDEGDGDEDPPADDDNDEPTGDDDDSPADDDDEDDNQDPPPKQSRGQTAIIEARRRAQDAEDKARRLEEELNSSRHGSPQPTQDQQLYAQEEARLKDPETTELERWQIQSNRTLRQTQQASQAALVEARDMHDRTSFDNRANNDPVVKKYASEVEKELTKLRSTGGNAPREAIAAMLIGRDVMAGNYKPKTTAKPNDVKRGKTPNARSDVSTKGRVSEHEKRARRLENQQI